jgi:hypothetical protein
MKRQYLLPTGKPASINMLVDLIINYTNNNQYLQDGFNDAMFAYDYDLDVKFIHFKNRYLVRKFIPAVISNMRREGIISIQELPSAVRPDLYQHYLKVFRQYCETHAVEVAQVPTNDVQKEVLKEFAGDMYAVLVDLSKTQSAAADIVHEIVSKIKSQIP